MALTGMARTECARAVDAAAGGGGSFIVVHRAGQTMADWVRTRRGDLHARRPGRARGGQRVDSSANARAFPRPRLPGLGCVATAAVNYFRRLPAARGHQPLEHWRMRGGQDLRLRLDGGPDARDHRVLRRGSPRQRSCRIEELHGATAHRGGAYHDTEVGDRYVETFVVNSWAEHLRRARSRDRPIAISKARATSCAASRRSAHPRTACSVMFPLNPSEDLFDHVNRPAGAALAFQTAGAGSRYFASAVSKRQRAKVRRSRRSIVRMPSNVMWMSAPSSVSSVMRRSSSMTPSERVTVQSSPFGSTFPRRRSPRTGPGDRNVMRVPCRSGDGCVGAVLRAGDIGDVFT